MLQTETRLTALFQKKTWARLHQKYKNIPDFNEARDDGMAVASSGQYAKIANHLHLTQDG